MGFNYDFIALMYAKQIKGGIKKIENVPSNLKELTLKKLQELEEEN